MNISPGILRKFFLEFRWNFPWNFMEISLETRAYYLLLKSCGGSSWNLVEIFFWNLVEIYPGMLWRVPRWDSPLEFVEMLHGIFWRFYLQFRWDVPWNLAKSPLWNVMEIYPGMLWKFPLESRWDSPWNSGIFILESISSKNLERYNKAIFCDISLEIPSLIVPRIPLSIF